MTINNTVVNLSNVVQLLQEGKLQYQPGYAFCTINEDHVKSRYIVGVDYLEVFTDKVSNEVVYIALNIDEECKAVKVINGKVQNDENNTVGKINKEIYTMYKLSVSNAYDNHY